MYVHSNHLLGLYSYGYDWRIKMLGNCKKKLYCAVYRELSLVVRLLEAIQ